MKKMISLFSILIFLFCISLNSGFAFSQDPDISTSVLFITEDNNELDFINNLEDKLKDNEFVKENKISKIGFEQLGKRIAIKDTKKAENLNFSDIEAAEAILVNYNYLDNEKVIDYAKKQVNEGKIIYFYGNNVNIKKFASLFNLENSIPKETDAKKTQNMNQSENLLNAIAEKKEPIFVGVEKNEWGYGMITGEDSDFNFYRAAGYLLKDALHGKEVKTTKPYQDLNKQTKSTVSEKIFNSEVYAANIDDYPIVNYQRKSTSFKSNAWYLISDCYLHRVSDNDPTYDYFILETISELDIGYNGILGSADEYFSKLKLKYSDDVVRAGGPSSQGGTTAISVNFSPPSVGFTYYPGGKVSVSSTLSLSGNYFEAYFKEAELLSNSFPRKSIHRTDLSFSNYAPQSSYTYVSIDIYQAAKETLNVYYYAFNPANYYYDYN